MPACVKVQLAIASQTDAAMGTPPQPLLPAQSRRFYYCETLLASQTAPNRIGWCNR